MLKSLREDARHYLEDEVTEAVITVPAYFNDNQRQATKQAGELAGLRVRRIVNEPTAAALTYGFHDRDAEKKILVIDLGGGTFDVTLMDVFEGTLEIVSTAGENFLGGEDFTDRLMAGLLQQAGHAAGICRTAEPHRVARLRQQCEVAKQQLTTIDSVKVKMPDAAGQIADDALTVNISRAGVHKSRSARWSSDSSGPVAKALRDGRAVPEDIEDVILVGGATRMPVVHDFVRSFFSKEPLCKFNPDEVVALGAAVQAALIADDQAVDDLVMTDVCPFTLGIDTVKEFGPEYKTGYFTPIIHRNTTIPVSKEQIFSTIAANQREVKVVVYQGEHRRVEQNLKIGELTVTGIPPGPAGKTILHSLHVRPQRHSGSRSLPARVAERNFAPCSRTTRAGCQKQELDEAVRKLQSLKYYPREDMEMQRLLRYCERLVGEVSPFHRPQLEAAIDSFEAAMGSGDQGVGRIRAKWPAANLVDARLRIPRWRMSDAQTQPRQPAIDYMVRLLQMNPIQEGDEIVEARSKALGLGEEAEAANTPGRQRAKVERRKLLAQLDAIRAEFWTMPIDALQAKLATLNAGLRRLGGGRRAAAGRGSASQPVSEAARRSAVSTATSFRALKEVLIRSPRDTAVLTRTSPIDVPQSARRKSGRQMVELLKNEMPAIYELEADWFETLRRQKPAIFTSNVKRVRPATIGSGAGAGRYWWGISIVAITLILRLCIAN